MKKTYPILRLALAAFISTAPILSYAQPTPIYKDPSQPIEARVQDLLGRMTIEEKTAQLRHIHEGSILNDDRTLNLDKMKNIIGTLGWGAVEGLTLTGTEMARYTRQIQQYCIENTRLGIPIFTVSESLHGAVQDGATIFPQAVALGCTFNPGLAYQMTKAISGELKAMGVNQVLSPVIDVIHELRWGRVEESFGEDPFLVSQMGVHEINGYIDGGISPMLKVLGPHGIPTSGLNLASTEAGERDLREFYLKPYEVAVKRTGVNAVMTAYNSTNRIPNTASKWLLTDLLRTEWGFKGYTYSDWGAVSMLYSFHKVAADAEEAAKMALEAGTDLEASSDCYARIPEMVRSGKLDIKYVDQACSRVLYAKFKAGLFENPYGLPLEEYDAKVHTEEHIALSRRISEESVVLAKNDNNLLPLDINSLRSIAVIGPNANQVQFGDYTWSRDNKDGITPLQGIRNLAGNRLDVHYAAGCDLVSDNRSGFAEAVAAAKKSDVVLLFMGSASASLARDYSNCTCGEGYDLTDLNLTGVQGDLIKEIYATGKPVVLIMATGRPFSITREKEHIPAILFQWYGGEREGEVIADILFGKVNPSGSFCYSIPQSVGHLPVHYNRLPSDKGFYRSPGRINRPGRDYVFSDPEPLWAFGHGLSYSHFEYGDVRFNKNTYSLTDTVHIRVNVKNTSAIEGKSTVQVYVRDLVSSVVMPAKQLKGFAKVTVPASGNATAEIAVPVDELELYDKNMQYAVEPGDFEFMIGTASDNIFFKKTLHVGEKQDKMEKKALPQAEVTPTAKGKSMTVRGIVRDVQAKALDNVQVSVKGEKGSVSTNEKGEYTIRATSAGTLVFNKKGYETKELEVKAQNTLNVTLSNKF